MTRWEYMTWDTTDTKTGRSIAFVNGVRLDEYRLEYSALAEAGAQGWELVTVVSIGGAKIGNRHEHTLYFRRPLAEDAPT